MVNKVVIVNDNHYVRGNDGRYEFRGSKFHLFTKGFERLDVYLSSPSLDAEEEESCIEIDGVKILPRIGYGKVYDFYKTILINIGKHYNSLKDHIKTADVVLLVAPACTLPISYIVCRLLKKPIALYVVGDVVEVVSQDKGHSPVKYIKKCAAKWEWAVTRYISEKHICFSLGRSLFNKLSANSYDLKPAMTSLVSDKSIVVPEKKHLTDTIKILSVSRLSKEKGIAVALEMIQELKKNFDVLYTIIGDGPEMRGLKRKSNSLGLNDIVVFKGHLEQGKIRDYYLVANVFLLPSLSEGIPKVVLDAMAAAVPVVATAVGGIPDLVSDDQSRGWLVKPGSVNELELAVTECIRNDEKRYCKLLSAHSYIKKHTIKAEANRIESLLLNLIDK